MTTTDLPWRDDIWLRTPRQTKTGGWANLVDRVMSGNVVAIVPWLRTGGKRRHDPIAVIVPAWWATTRSGSTGTRVQRLPGTEMRRDLSTLCEQVENDFVDGTPSMYVAARYYLPHGRARAAKEGGVRHSAPSDGSDTIAVVSAEWFADQVGVDLTEVQRVAYQAWDVEQRKADDA